MVEDLERLPTCEYEGCEKRALGPSGGCEAHGHVFAGARARGVKRPDIGPKISAAKTGKPRPDMVELMRTAWKTGGAAARASLKRCGGRARLRWLGRWNAHKGGHKKGEKKALRTIDQALQYVAQKPDITRRQLIETLMLKFERDALFELDGDGEKRRRSRRHPDFRSARLRVVRQLERGFTLRGSPEELAPLLRR